MLFSWNQIGLQLDSAYQSKTVIIIVYSTSTWCVKYAGTVLIVNNNNHNDNDNNNNNNNNDNDNDNDNDDDS